MKCCVAASITWPMLVSAKNATMMRMPAIAAAEILVACSAAAPPAAGRACSRPCGRLRVVANRYLLDNGCKRHLLLRAAAPASNCATKPAPLSRLTVSARITVGTRNDIDHHCQLGDDRLH